MVDKSFALTVMALGVSIIIIAVLGGRYSECQEPFVKVGSSCCLDRNQNDICDDRECFRELTFGIDNDGFCRNFTFTCLPEGWKRIDECPEATCDDGIKNCHDGGCEVDVDYGGPCGEVVFETCFDEILNQGEEDVDCGGPCPPCFITLNIPTCFDGIQNQNETGIDCGGPCPNCLPTCFDGIQNQNEMGIDCGGPCPNCLENQPEWVYTTDCHVEDQCGILSIALSSEDNYIVAGSVDDCVYLLNWRGVKLGSYCTRGDVVDVDISGDGNYVVAASQDKYAYFFRSVVNRSLYGYSRRYELGDTPNSVSVSDAGEYMVVGSFHNRTVEKGTGQVLRFNSSGVLTSRTDLGYYITEGFVDSSRTYVVMGATGVLHSNSWSLDLGLVDYYTDILHSGSVYVVVSPNNIYLVNSDGKLVGTRNLTNPVVSVSGRGDVAVGSDEVTLYDRYLNLTWVYNNTYPVKALAISNSGKYVAFWAEDRFLKLLDSKGVLKWRHFTGRRITDIAISDDDSFLVAGTYSGSVILYNITIESIY